MQKKSLFSAFILAACISCAQDSLTEDIRLNQVGFYPEAKKIAVIVNESPADFFIASANGGHKLFSAKLSAVHTSSWSPRKTRIADFSTFTTPGTYVVVVPGLGHSYPFEIKPKVHEGVARAAVKGFYFQRFSIPLAEPYAGKWKRAASPSHEKILIHPSAASPGRPAGSIISSPRGWIDAGDYNKYIVNSGITTGTLLSAYEDYPEYYDTLNLNIPESGNALPDLLDEALWNIRWMMTMQDPGDGGVYHKCTNARFDPMIMPDQAVTPRYVVQKGTAATLDFAAVMAQASRILSKFEKQLPMMADSCLHAANYAWQWAKHNPGVVYDQRKMNREFDPDITTGAYGDRDFSDEFIWAAAELYTTTKDAQYLEGINLLQDTALSLPSWSRVGLLGYYSLIRKGQELPQSFLPALSEMKRRILQKADKMVEGVGQRTYQTVMGRTPQDFIWGSNAVAANEGILLIQAFLISKDSKYLDDALSNLDYILGRNATGYSFVTGYGDKTPMHPHHRLSEADGIVDPVPGLLAGGPNPGMQDKCSYPSAVPDEAYLDDVCSYASNEIAINWNAPLAYLAGAMEALEIENKKF